MKNYDKQVVGFQYVYLQSLKIPNKTIDITGVTTDIDIFEHLDKPYLTAVIAFTDTEGKISQYGVGSGDIITVVLASQAPDTIPIVKSFAISKVTSSSRGNDSTEHFIMHLVEDIKLASSLANINKSYSGKCSEIIKKIMNDGWDPVTRELISSNTDDQSMKVIVPNMTPIEAMSWVKNRATTEEGFPLFLFRTLVGFDMHFLDLKTILNDLPIFITPFSYIEGNMSSNASSEVGRRRTIKHYESSDDNSLMAMIDNGLIGAKYEYLDTIMKTEHKFDFDFKRSVIDNALDACLPMKCGRTQTHRYNPIMNFHERKSRRVTQIGGNLPYENFMSYSESASTGKYKLNVVNRSMENVFRAKPLTITVDGADFFNGTTNTTIGTKIPVRFLKSKQGVDIEKGESAYDPIMSGDYVIYAAKHSFKDEGYVVALSCLKLFDGDV